MSKLCSLSSSTSTWCPLSSPHCTPLKVSSKPNIIKVSELRENLSTKQHCGFSTKKLCGCLLCHRLVFEGCGVCNLHDELSLCEANSEKTLLHAVLAVCLLDQSSSKRRSQSLALSTAPLLLLPLQFGTAPFAAHCVVSQLRPSCVGGCLLRLIAGLRPVRCGDSRRLQHLLTMSTSGHDMAHAFQPRNSATTRKDHVLFFRSKAENNPCLFPETRLRKSAPVLKKKTSCGRGHGQKPLTPVRSTKRRPDDRTSRLDVLRH